MFISVLLNVKRMPKKQTVPTTITFRGKKYKRDERWGGIKDKSRATMLADYIRNRNFTQATYKKFNNKYYLYARHGMK